MTRIAVGIVTALALALPLITATTAQAADGTIGEITVHEPWARASAPAARNGAGYITLYNAGGGADRLIGASSPAAERVELHTTIMDGDIMRMRELDAIDLPSGVSVALEPGGYHLMFMGLVAPLETGATVSVTLEFENNGTGTVMLMVMDGAPGGSGHGDMDHGDMDHGDM